MNRPAWIRIQLGWIQKTDYRNITIVTILLHEILCPFHDTLPVLIKISGYCKTLKLLTFFFLIFCEKSRLSRIIDPDPEKRSQKIRNFPSVVDAHQFHYGSVSGFVLNVDQDPASETGSIRYRYFKSTVKQDTVDPAEIRSFGRRFLEKSARPKRVQKIFERPGTWSIC